MPDVSTHLALPYLQPAQAQKHVTLNEALRLLDRLVQLAVLDRDRTVPPAAAVEGARHIVPEGATGAWDGQAGRLAIRETGAWQFVSPGPGWRAHVLAEGRSVAWTGTAWTEDATASALTAQTLGLNASADSFNRLAVAAPGTLLTHDGAGHRLVVNKAAPTDTASLLFQTGWSGRAEMGTTGADDFAVKVSADGSSWTTALQVAAATGQTDLAAGSSVAGAPIHTRATIVGPVSQAGGLPTGAVVERGSSADGSWTRWADGTQLCQHSLVTATDAPVAWSFPVPMVAGSAQVQATASDAAPRIVTVEGLGAAGVSVNGWLVSGARAAVEVHLAATGRWF